VINPSAATEKALGEAFRVLKLGGQFAVSDSGAEATSVRTAAVPAMAELGVDTSGQEESKTLERWSATWADPSTM